MDSEERIRGAILRNIVKRGVTNPILMTIMPHVKLVSDVGSAGIVIEAEGRIVYDPFAIAVWSDEVLNEMAARAVSHFIQTIAGRR